MELSEKQVVFIELVGANESRDAHLVMGWPREYHYRTVVGRWSCPRCRDGWTEELSSEGTFEDDDFTDNLCPTCGHEGVLTIEDEDECSDELGFSAMACECCGSPLAGDRFAVTLHHSDPDLSMPYRVCQDCLMYIANGDIPDDENLSWIGD